MSTHELASKAQELKELKLMKEEVEAEIAALEDAIKAHMGEAEEITAGAFKIRWKTVSSSRLDTKALQADQPALCARYTIQSVARRFSVA